MSQALDWRRVAIFTPLAAAVAICLVFARDLRHKQVMIIAVLLFALYTTLFQVLPMRELDLPAAARRSALLFSLAGVAVYLGLVRTDFFSQTSPTTLFLLIFTLFEIALILIVRTAATAARD